MLSVDGWGRLRPGLCQQQQRLVRRVISPSRRCFYKPHKPTKTKYTTKNFKEESPVQLSDLLGLLGGLALFLYGMQMMSSGLEAAAGDRMKSILERLTANRFMGVLVGAAITAVIQSSSATTVMVVGFVNAGMMTLNQAVWIIMGANVGTTVTGILVSLDMGAIAPLFAFLGVVFVVFVKKPKLQNIGQILAGLGVLFIGMDMMSAAMAPLRDSQTFIHLVSNFSNPLLGILAGAGFTAVVQSSSAAVGILQTLSNSGIIPFSSAVFVLFGSNIGTCITAVLAAIGTSRNARRTTIIHLMFNIIGTVVFTIAVMVLPITDLIESLIPGPMAQIAAMHTSFNIITTILLLPLGNYLAKAAVKILPELPEEDADEAMKLEYLTPVHPTAKENVLGSSAIYVDQLQHELMRMLSMARSNVQDSFDTVLNRSRSQVEQISKTEDYLDFLNKEISKHISNLITYETNERSSTIVSSYFTISSNIERIGDHAMNVCGYSKRLLEKNVTFSEEANREMLQMRDVCLKAIDALLKDTGDLQWLSEIAALEQKIDDMTIQFRRNHLGRMRSGVCSDEACILYAELLTDFERIGDHVLNIGQELTVVHEQA